MQLINEDISLSYFSLALLVVIVSVVSFAAGNFLKDFIPSLTKGPSIKIPSAEWPTRKYRDFEKILRFSRDATHKFIHDPTKIKLLKLFDLKTRLPEGCKANEILIDGVKVVEYEWNNIGNSAFTGIKHDENDIPSYLQLDKDWEFKYWKYENISISCIKCKEKMKLNYVKDITKELHISCGKCNRIIGSKSLIYSCQLTCNTYCTTCAAKDDEHAKNIVKNYSQNEPINIDNDVDGKDISGNNDEIYKDAETVEIENNFAKFLIYTKDNEEEIRGKSPRGVIISIHGGGYIRLSAASIATQCAQLSRLTNMKCVSVDYRKAPEHPLPKPMEDVIKVYKYYLEKFNNDSSKIIFQGNSAGAGMVLLILQHIRDKKNLPMPLCAVCISPCADLTGTAPTLYYNKHYDSVLTYRLNGYSSMQSPGNFIVGNWNDDSKEKFLMNPLSRIQRRNIHNIQHCYKRVIEKQTKEDPNKKLFGLYYYNCNNKNDDVTKHHEKYCKNFFQKNHSKLHFYRILDILHKTCNLRPKHDEHKNVIANYRRLDDHEFSPVFGEFINLCPIYFTVGQHEVLLHDTLKCIQKCKQSNVECEFEILSYGCHTYPVFSDIFPEANEANARIGVFINKHYSNANNKQKKC